MRTLWGWMPHRAAAACAAGVLALIASLDAAAQTTGAGFGFTIGIGTQGSFSYVEGGVILPKLGGNLEIQLKARALSSLTWTPTLDRSLTPSVFHPVAVGGVVSFGGYSPMYQNTYRMYGGSELFLGYTFTPYDSAFYGRPNLVGPNLTYAILGYFGIELFTEPWIATYLDAGGGFKNLFVSTDRKSDPYVVAASWPGSGFGIRMGTHFYP